MRNQLVAELPDAIGQDWQGKWGRGTDSGFMATELNQMYATRDLCDIVEEGALSDQIQRSAVQSLRDNEIAYFPGGSR